MRMALTGVFIGLGIALLVLLLATLNVIMAVLCIITMCAARRHRLDPGTGRPEPRRGVALGATPPHAFLRASASVQLRRALLGARLHRAAWLAARLGRVACRSRS